MKRAITSASQRAERIASFATNPESVDLVSEFVGMKLDSYAVGANGKAIKVLMDIQKSSLDIIA